MRHLNAGRKFSRSSSHRKAMFRNLADSLIQFGRIQTTWEKAKALQPYADRLITLGKKNTVEARRQAVNLIRTPESLDRLFNELAKLFANRQGGYTRVLPLSQIRRGDSASLALIEYCDVPLVERGKTEKDKDADAKGKKAAKKNEGEAKEASKKVAKSKEEKKAAKEAKAAKKAEAKAAEKAEKKSASPKDDKSKSAKKKKKKK